MTFAQFVKLLHDYGLDVILLGFLNSLFAFLFKRLFLKADGNEPKNCPAGASVLSGMILYALWFLIAFKEPSLLNENAVFIAERGLFVGAAPSFLKNLVARLTKKADGENGGEEPAKSGEGNEAEKENEENEENEKNGEDSPTGEGEAADGGSLPEKLLRAVSELLKR